MSQHHHRLAAFAHCLFFSFTVLAGTAAPAGQPAAPEPLVHQGNRIVVPEGSPLRQRVVVAAADDHSGARRLSVPAIVEADPARVVAVLPPLTGRLLRLAVGLGDTVRRGQTLAVIGSPDYGQAREDALKADDALDLANKALARARSVLTVGANATKDVEAAESQQRQAVVEAERARDRLATVTGTPHADVQATAFEVRSPVSGAVTALNVGTGAYLTDATAPMMTVSGLDRVWVTAQVPEQSMGAIVPGTAVDVSFAAYPGQTFHGKAMRVGPVLEPDTRRLKIRIPFDNANGRFKPNMYATAVFAVPQPGGVSVPISALLMNNDSTTVLVERAPWTFERRSVELGAEDNGTVRIRSGLQSGERVVVRGGILLND